LRAKRIGGNWATQGRGGMLSEIAYCGHCGGVMHWHNPGKNYWCSTRRKFGETACPAAMVAAKRIDALVLEQLCGLAIPQEVQASVIQEVQHRLGHQQRPKRDVTTAREQLRRLSVAYRMGDPELTDAIYLRERARLERIIADEPVPSAQVLDLTKAMGLLSDMPKLIEAANVPQRRALVRQVFEQVWLEKTKVTAVKPSPQFGLLLEAVVSGTISTGLEPATFSSGG
jgi:hypothetical protein